MDEHHFGLVKLLVFGALGIGLGLHQLWSLRRAREKPAREKRASEKAPGSRDPAD